MYWCWRLVDTNNWADLWACGGTPCEGSCPSDAFLSRSEGLDHAWAMARRMPSEYRRKADAATRCLGVCPHTWPELTICRQADIDMPVPQSFRRDVGHIGWFWQGNTGEYVEYYLCISVRSLWVRHAGVVFFKRADFPGECWDLFFVPKLYWTIISKCIINNKSENIFDLVNRAMEFREICKACDSFQNKRIILLCKSC